MKSNRRKWKIAIVGAGVGGLSAGIALRRRGFPVQVYERAANFTKVGAGIVVGANAMRVYQELGCAERITAAGRPLEYVELRTQQDRELTRINVRRAGATLNATSCAIHRAELHAILADRFERLGGEIITGREFVEMRFDSNGATLSFATGDDAVCDIAIGADGIHSRVRAALFGSPRIRKTGQSCWRGVADNSAYLDLQADASLREFLGPGSRFGVVPINAHSVYWYAVLNDSRSGTSPDDAEFQEHFGNWNAHAKLLIAATPKQTVTGLALADIAPASQWHRECCVLLGDAIHPTTPNIGQGAAMAIESAYALAECLAGATNPTEAFARYQRIRYPRTKLITEQSRMLGRINQTRSRWLAGMRDAALRVAPGRLQTRSLQRFLRGNPVDRALSV